MLDINDTAPRWRDRKHTGAIPAVNAAALHRAADADVFTLRGAAKYAGLTETTARKWLARHRAPELQAMIRRGAAKRGHDPLKPKPKMFERRIPALAAGRVVHGRIGCAVDDKDAVARVKAAVKAAKAQVDAHRAAERAPTAAKRPAPVSGGGKSVSPA